MHAAPALVYNTPMNMYATKYEILRGIPANAMIKHDLPVKPLKVCTIIDEAKFLASGGLLKHNQTVFFEDQFHDWLWDAGKLSYFTRVAAVADVIVVYELEKR